MKTLSTIPPRGRALEAEERSALLEHLAEVVEASHLFKSLDDEGRDLLLRSGYVMGYDAGDVIIREGEEGNAMFLVMSGRVAVQATGPQGPLPLAELSRGACLGEVAVLSGSPRTATVTAIEEATLVAFESHRIQRLLERYPRVRKILETVVEGRAKDTVEKLLGG